MGPLDGSKALTPVAWGAVGAVLVDRITRFLVNQGLRRQACSSITAEPICPEGKHAQQVGESGAAPDQRVTSIVQRELELEQKEEELQEALHRANNLSKSNEFLVAQVEQLEQNLMVLSTRESRKVQQLQQQLEQAVEYSQGLETEYAMLEKEFEGLKAIVQAAGQQPAVSVTAPEQQAAEPAVAPAAPSMPGNTSDTKLQRASGENLPSAYRNTRKTQSDVLPHAASLPSPLRADLPDITDPNFQGPRVRSVVKAIEGWKATQIMPPAIAATATK